MLSEDCHSNLYFIESEKNILKNKEENFNENDQKMKREMNRVSQAFSFIFELWLIKSIFFKKHI